MPCAPRRGARHPGGRARHAPRRAPRRHLHQPLLSRGRLSRAGLPPAGHIHRRAPGGAPRRPPRRRAHGDPHPHRRPAHAPAPPLPDPLPPRRLPLRRRRHGLPRRHALPRGARRRQGARRATLRLLHIEPHVAGHAALHPGAREDHRLRVPRPPGAGGPPGVPAAARSRPRRAPPGARRPRVWPPRRLGPRLPPQRRLHRQHLRRPGARDPGGVQGALRQGRLPTGVRRGPVGPLVAGRGVGGRAPVHGVARRAAGRVRPVRVLRQRRHAVDAEDRRAGRRAGGQRPEVPVGGAVPQRQGQQRVLLQWREDDGRPRRRRRRPAELPAGGVRGEDEGRGARGAGVGAAGGDPGPPRRRGLPDALRVELGAGGRDRGRAGAGVAAVRRAADERGEAGVGARRAGAAGAREGGRRGGAAGGGGRGGQGADGGGTGAPWRGRERASCGRRRCRSWWWTVHESVIVSCVCVTAALFSSRKFLCFSTIALLFLFNN
ncbi:hypothetical protein PVAP13_2KG129882 [Panicum virgatum]|uniref:Uncharacterized protein n=1 Tax=Panicum virgatum TaxID=38727 RepID=A0A8T0W5K6_PANVG|nr:hypothetical protein PVAP13_2KG129882 [Panicum virgatum]